MIGRTMKKYPLIVGILTLLAAGAGAQTRESITVQVVDVPVYVFSHGKPIRDLTKDDFELYVNGKRQTIDYFDPIELTSAKAAGQAVKAEAPAADPRARRLFLLLFDLAYSRPAALARARKAAAVMVDHALPQDLFAVATWGSSGASFIIPFTRDHDVIRRAVFNLAPSKARDGLAISITNAERETASAWNAAAVSGEDTMPDIMAGFAPEERQRAKTAGKAQFNDLSGLAARLREIEGYKHVILFSEGFDQDLVTGVIPNLPAGQAPDFDPAMRRALQSLFQSFHAAGALLHTVDLRITDPMNLNEKNGPPQWAVHQRFDPVANDLLYGFAANTGGQFIHWTNDLTAALADLSTTVSAGYRLGFTPVDPKKGENTIDVKVKNVPSGTTISFRKGFSSTPEARNAEEALLLADIIQNDIPQTGTPPLFSFAALPFVDVIIPARQLAHERGAIADASLMLYIFDGKGNVVDFREKKISIPATPANDMAIRQKLTLAPGNYVAKALLRVEKSIGFAKIAFTIPAENGEARRQ